MTEGRIDIEGASSGLLVAGDAGPVIVDNIDADSPFLLIGDHAGTAIPAKLGDLGVSAADRTRHIALDIGIENLGRRLSALLGAPFIRQRYSRLVIDCNRVPGNEGYIPKESDGTSVPGNAGLSREEAEARVVEIYQPYQDRIGAEITRRKARGEAPVLISLHSFTPTMNGKARPWRFGVLHKENSPFSSAVLALLRKEFGEAAGDNEPYRMDEIDNTVPLHAEGQAIDYLEIEIRQDLICDDTGCEQVAAYLARLLPRALERAASSAPSG